MMIDERTTTEMSKYVVAELNLIIYRILLKLKF